MQRLRSFLQIIAVMALILACAEPPQQPPSCDQCDGPDDNPWQALAQSPVPLAQSLEFSLPASQASAHYVRGQLNMHQGLQGTQEPGNFPCILFLEPDQPPRPSQHYAYTRLPYQTASTSATSELSVDIVDCNTLQHYRGPLTGTVVIEALTVPDKASPTAMGELAVAVVHAYGGQTNIPSYQGLVSNAVDEASAMLQDFGIQAQFHHFSTQMTDIATINPHSFEGIELHTTGPLQMLPLVLGTCVVEIDASTHTEDRPLGKSRQIPGGLGWGLGSDPDAVIIPMYDCTSFSSVKRYSDAGFLAPVMVHEMMHFLGLRHTNDGPFTDQIADTDQHNLMHPDIQRAQSRGLSPTQLSIVKTHPLLQQPHAISVKHAQALPH